jgi:peroxiredoxin
MSPASVSILVSVLASIAVVGAVAIPGPPAGAGDALARSAAPQASRAAEHAARRPSIEESLRKLDLIRPGRVRAAAEFAVATADGKGFRLNDYRGRVVFVNFWATWCPPCREEMPSMERLYARHRDRGFVVMAISVDADPRVVTPFVKETGITFPVGLDPKMDVANAYGVRALPSSFLVDRQGNLAALAMGPRTWDNEASHALIEALVARR